MGVAAFISSNNSSYIFYPCQCNFGAYSGTYNSSYLQSYMQITSSYSGSGYVGWVVIGN
jgi:hypothetical protein